MSTISSAVIYLSSIACFMRIWDIIGIICSKRLP